MMLRIILACISVAALNVSTGCSSQPALPGLVQTGQAPDLDPRVLQEIKANAARIPAAEIDSDEVVCVIERPTGSHITRERCYTREELRRMSDASQEFLRSRGQSGSLRRVYSVQ